MGLTSKVFWGAGTLTASLFPLASFLSTWDQTVYGNECLVEGSGGAAVGGAAGMAEWQRTAGDGSKSPWHQLLQISISTMSDKSWTRDAVTESAETRAQAHTSASASRALF